MATGILASVLRSLSNVYRFTSGGVSAPSEFELDLPIQGVHDLSTMAGLGAAIGPSDGFWVQETEFTHVAVGTIIFNASMRFPATVYNGYPPIPSYNPETQQCWIYQSWGYCTDDSDFNYMLISILHAESSIGPVGTTAVGILPHLIFRSTTVVRNLCLPTHDMLEGRPTPILLAPQDTSATDAFLECVSVADTLGTTVNTCCNLIWVGPKGVRPPMG